MDYLILISNRDSLVELPNAAPSGRAVPEPRCSARIHVNYSVRVLVQPTQRRNNL